MSIYYQKIDFGNECDKIKNRGETVKGIEFDSLKDISLKLAECNQIINDNTSAIQKQFRNVLETYSGTDLDFLGSKIDVEISQFKVLNINNSYNPLIINKIIDGYLNEHEILKQTILQATPINVNKIEEEK